MFLWIHSLFFFLAILPNIQPEVTVHPAAVEVQRPKHWITYFSFAVLLCSFFCVLSQYVCMICMYSYIHSLEKGMATHSSILAWRIPWTEKSLVGYSPWGHKESDMAEWLSLTHSLTHSYIYYSGIHNNVHKTFVYFFSFCVIFHL